MDESVLTVVVLLGLVALRGVLVGIGAALLLRPVSGCPACAAPTLGLHRPWLRRLLPFVEWRWCPECGWSGPARHLDSSTAPRVVSQTQESAR